jgi:signal transduction histidine kinase
MTSSPAPVPGSDAAATILVVDDEPNNVDVVRHFLEMEGLRVVGAMDGEAALERLAVHAPDVILLDVIMPGPDGFEICRRLKADPHTVFIPVVLLTALRGVDDRIKGAAAGADDFVSKPFDHVELVTRVKSLVRVKRLHDQIEAHNRELERRVAERTADLQRALDQLRELDRLKSEFIANTSHELRTPLLHVKGAVHLLADGAMGPLTAQQTEGVAVAQRAIDQLERVVGDVVDFHEANQRQLDFAPVSVAEVFRGVLQVLEPMMARRNTTVALDLPSDLPPVRANRAALTQALRHLVDNAIKFGPPDGTVTLRASLHGPLVRLAVEDHGQGIPADKLPHIFDSFYQADGSATRRVGGIGLGLALVKMLVEAHASEIQVHSQAGQGTVFYFDLSVAVE